MKGGRLHRPDPPAPHASAPADDWVDGSWTVDCSCGVTFDDGEEMVSCDDCSVWVHTRCARYNRGAHGASFSCHNCRRRRSAADDEAEVAELLAELPTHRPYRRWAEVPLPARVHVHGGAMTDAALFRGAPSSPAFSAALWRCAGYVPKKFGFRYCEFPSWAEVDKDGAKDGADALFALAREKRKETAQPQAAIFPLPLGNKGDNDAQTLSKRDEGSQHAGDDSAKEVPPRTEVKTKGASKIAAEADRQDNGFGTRQDLNIPDTMHKDQFVDLNVANSDFKVAVKANKKAKESLKPSEEKKSSEGNPRMPKTEEPKDSMRMEISSGARTTSAVPEQEAHSPFVKAEVNMCTEEIKGGQNVGLQSGIMDADN